MITLKIVLSISLLLNVIVFVLDTVPYLLPKNRKKTTYIKEEQKRWTYFRKDYIKRLFRIDKEEDFRNDMGRSKKFYRICVFLQAQKVHCKK
jgi:hypothetical protein